MEALNTVEELYNAQHEIFSDPSRRICNSLSADDQLAAIKLGLTIARLSIRYQRMRVFYSNAAVLHGYAAFESVLASLAIHSMRVRGLEAVKLPYDLNDSRKEISLVLPEEVLSRVAWSEVESYQKVRNWIAHDGGVLSFNENVKNINRRDAVVDRERRVKALVEAGDAAFISYDLEPWDEGGATGYVQFEHSYVIRGFQLYREVIAELSDGLGEREKKC